MNEYEIYEANLKQVCKEIKDITEKIQKNGTASEQEYKLLDLLYHLKKDILTSHAMEESEESSVTNVSGMRGRSPMTGRYVSRDNSYEDGYSQGYSQAMEQMNRGNSGHNPYYPEPRRW